MWTCVTRGKVSVGSPSRLKGRATPTRKGAGQRERLQRELDRGRWRLLGNGQPRPVLRNRERELGLDRRETG